MAKLRTRTKWPLWALAGVILAFTSSVKGDCEPLTATSAGDESFPDYFEYFKADFTLLLEMTEVYYNRTNYVKHSYHRLDDHGNQEETSAVEVHNSGIVTTYHYFPGESRYIEETDTTCTEPSVEVPVYMPYGWFDDDTTHGVTMYGPAAILREIHFEKEVRYDGGDHYVGGIRCEKWYACVDGEAQLNLYFSQRDAFDMPEKDLFPDEKIANRIPVMFEMIPSEEEHIIYTVVGFKPGLAHHSHIETPRGLSCEGKVSINPKKKIPKIPSHFFLSEELVTNPFIDNMNFQKDQLLDKFQLYYSEHLSVVRQDSTPPTSETEEDQKPDKVIHDFNTGVQYAISRVYGKCKRGFIPDYSLDERYDGMGGFGVMAGPNELFHIDESYAYVGPRGSRSLYSDLFTSTRSDIPDPDFDFVATLPKAVLEYYFTQGKESSPIPTLIPVRGDVFIYNRTDPSTIEQRVTTNVYNAKELILPSPSEFAVNECFDKYSDDWSTLYIFFPANKIQFAAVAAEEYEFKQYVYVYLLGMGDISPTRIGSIDVSDGSSGWYSNTSDSDVIVAEVKLMERAPYLYGYRIPDEPFQVPGEDEMEYKADDLEACAEFCSLEDAFDCKSFHFCRDFGACYLSNNEGAEGPQVKNFTCEHYIDNHDNMTFDDLPSAEVDVLLRKYIQEGKFSFKIKYVEVEVNFTATQHIMFKTPDPMDPIRFQFYTFKRYHTITSPDANIKLKDGSTLACMSACVYWMDFKCETIVHNFMTGECSLYSQHAAEVNSSRIEKKDDCTIHGRNYLTDYTPLLGGISINTTGPCVERILQCTRSQDYNCNSFEFCWEMGTCHLHVETFIDVSDGGNYSTHQACMHFEKKAEKIFTSYPNSGMPQKYHKLVAQLTSVSQCAKLCLEDTAETCQSYDFCTRCEADDFDVCGQEHKDGLNMCFLGDHHLGEPNLQLSTASSCDHYSRDLFGDQDYASWIASQRKHDKPYTGGSMAGIAFGMIFLGIVLALGFLYIVTKVSPSTLPKPMSLDNAPKSKPSVGPQSSVTFGDVSSAAGGESDI
ncbi:uncharacterized protein [Macrobrachium rosenbergii]|uniref:uncharacterized protein n=1 Tax=Macrobrachium rosenbergii TaxID=79674 RepID=UPI0034D52CE8